MARRYDAGRVRLDIPPCERCRRISNAEFDVKAWAEERSAEIAGDISKMIKEVTIEIESKMLREDWQQHAGHQ